ERFNVSRLVGAPPGYVGYEEGGQLTEAVRRNPYSVVLLDEIEKAHPEVFNILLQVAEDGRLTDSQGRVVDFKNTVIIMTSNIGAARIQQERGMGIRSDAERKANDEKAIEAMKNRVMEEVKKTFRPEFINRIDELIVFHPLTREEILQIVDLMLNRVAKQLKGQELALEVTQPVKEKLAEEGFDPNLGARPLRRAVQRLIEDPLADEILRGTFRPGDTVVADLEEDRIVFRPKAAEVLPAGEDGGLPPLETPATIG
ncbi:MAG TPA: AAA family ATPase, partial [Chthonomonas sp.]|uniref:AAA family ATPase n=1 Tax=Chthonomonas sp. TaxID=2282153 RepID=UPI002B4ADB4E